MQHLFSKSIIFFILVVTLLLVSCEGPKCREDYRITIVNNSNKSIYYHFYWSYPDTVIGDYNPIGNGTDGLQQGESEIIGPSLGFCWENMFEKSSKQFIHFFDADSLRLLSWDTIRKTQRGLLERREFDLIYLESSNWKLAYP